MIFDWVLVDFGRVLKIRLFNRELRCVIPTGKRRFVWRILRHFQFCKLKHWTVREYDGDEPRWSYTPELKAELEKRLKG